MLTDQDIERKFEELMARKLPEVLRGMSNNLRLARIEKIESSRMNLVVEGTAYRLRNVEYTPQCAGANIGDLALLVSTDPQYGSQNFVIATFGRMQLEMKDLFDFAGAELNTLVDFAGAELNTLVGSVGWTAFTPIWLNLTVGNGTNTGGYVKIANTVFFYSRFVLGSTSAVGTNPYYTVPISESSGQEFPLNILYRDADVGWYVSTGILSSGLVLPWLATLTGTFMVLGYPTATVPFTWTTNDKIIISGTYQAE
jgi:hypothetical protein